MSFASGGNFQFILSAINTTSGVNQVAGAVPMISTPTFTAAGGAQSVVVNTVNGGGEQAGTYTLVGYSGADPFANLTLTGGAADPAFNYALSDDTSANTIDLVVTNGTPEPGSLSLLGVGAWACSSVVAAWHGIVRNEQ